MTILRKPIMLCKGDNLLQKIVYARLVDDDSVDICFSGPRGSGKTYSLLSAAALLDPQFTVKNMANTTDGLLRVVAKLRALGNTKGKVIVYEESQDKMGNKRSMSVDAVEQVKLMSKYRVLGMIFIASTPVEAKLDKDFRSYFNMRFLAKGIDKRKKLAKFSLLMKDDYTEKWFVPSIRGPRTEILKANTIAFTLPPESIAKAYESMKDSYIDESIEDALTDLKLKRQSKLKRVRQLQ